jgi:hypothetical protein
MFRIPIFYDNQKFMSFHNASGIMTRHGQGDLLAGMKSMDAIWNDHCGDMAGDDDEFFDHWEYEVNAYNIVFEGMARLFAPDSEYSKAKQAIAEAVDGVE